MSPFYRVRWLLKVRRTVSLHPWQQAILYALLSDAARGDGTEAAWQLPEGLLLQAPEVARTVIEAGEEFAFGATLVDDEAKQASRRLHRLSRGLMRLGQHAPKKAVALGGNFDLIAVEDLVSGTRVSPEMLFAPIMADHVSAQCQQLLPLIGKSITLRFISPVRIELPQAEISDSRRYASDGHVNVRQLLHMVQKRLQAVGLVARDTVLPPAGDAEIELVENRLSWLDLAYGSGENRKSLGGAVGRVRVRVHGVVPLAALVWGQYSHVGKNLNFGFGRYYIEELGEAYPCRRSSSLMEQALAPTRVQRVAAEYELDPDKLLTAASQLVAGDYQPMPLHQIKLNKPDGGQRILQIPSRQDRALQRLLLNRLAPAFDKLFETSSFAWRRGLSREGAAKRIEKYARDGWMFAVKADFDRYFETIPQELLRDRLSAWCGDDTLAAAVGRFLPIGIGVPTGAPLSPLLGNLFLDHFDEQIERAGGKLIRYADDFLILTRTRDVAEQMLAMANSLAAELQLKLNDDTAILDLNEGFAFLGMQFRMEEHWQYSGAAGPTLVRELGWRDADRVPVLSALALPGETPAAMLTGVVLAGPEVAGLDIVGDQLHFTTSGKPHAVPLAGLEQLVLVGPPTLTADAPGKLLKANIPTFFISESGWPQGELTDAPTEDPDALIAQVHASTLPARRLAIAKAFVQAKVRNFATLLQAASTQHTTAVQQLRTFAHEMTTAPDLPTLLGLEGAAAALWYRCLPKLLSNGFRFTHRVAPDATDPVNVLLNIGHTMLYRQAIHACRAAGLSPVLGFVHTVSPRFAALAADLQEPFRHLIERAVILVTRRIKPTHFKAKEGTAYPLVLEPHAAKTFHVLLQRSLMGMVAGLGQTEPRAWLAQLVTTARSLRRHLTDPQQPWQPFEHPQ